MARTSQYGLVNAGDTIASQLGFVARSVIADNYTPFFCHIDDAQHDVPPWTVGVIYPIDGAQIGRATLFGGAATGPTLQVVTTGCILTFTDVSIPPNQGQSLVAASTAQRARKASISAGPNTTSAPVTVTLPVGTLAIGIIQVNAANLTNITITGVSSGKVYYNTQGTSADMDLVRIDPATDSSVTITVSAGAGGTSALADFYVVLAPEIVQVRGSSSFPVPVTFPTVPTVTTSPSSVIDVTDRAGRLLGVVTQSPSRPFDWTQQGTFTNGAASLSQIGVTGRRTVLAAYIVEASNAGATGYSSDVIWSGAGGTYWRDSIAHPATTQQGVNTRNSGLLVATAGTFETLTMAMQINPGPNEFVAMAMGGYYI